MSELPQRSVCPVHYCMWTQGKRHMLVTAQEDTSGLISAFLSYIILCLVHLSVSLPYDPQPGVQRLSVCSVDPSSLLSKPRRM